MGKRILEDNNCYKSINLISATKQDNNCIRLIIDLKNINQTDMNNYISWLHEIHNIFLFNKIK